MTHSKTFDPSRSQEDQIIKYIKAQLKKAPLTASVTISLDYEAKTEYVKTGKEFIKEAFEKAPEINITLLSSNQETVKVSVEESEYTVETVFDTVYNHWPMFEHFWKAYDKKVGDRDKIEAKWNKLKQVIKEKIMLHLDQYVPGTPDKKFRLNPETYLNQKGWNNEIINLETAKRITSVTPEGTRDRLNSYTD